jgi:hypothetical protein
MSSVRGSADVQAVLDLFGLDDSADDARVLSTLMNGSLQVLGALQLILKDRRVAVRYIKCQLDAICKV